MSNTEKGESETLIERCGYCNRPKRLENATSLSPDSCQCPSASDSTDPSIRLGAVPSSAFRRSPSVAPPHGQSETTIGCGKVEIISIREKHGYFRKAIPHMPVPVAVILCIFNAVIPGLGTLFTVVAVLCGCKTELEGRRRPSLINLMAALLQVLSSPIIVGWIWSVLWGITFVNIAVSKGEEDPTNSML